MPPTMCAGTIIIGALRINSGMRNDMEIRKANNTRRYVSPVDVMAQPHC